MKTKADRLLISMVGIIAERVNPFALVCVSMVLGFILALTL